MLNFNNNFLLKAITGRIVEVISYLAKQNLALRVHRREEIPGLSEPEDTIGDNIMIGNFLATIRLLAKYDAILAEHVQGAKEKPKKVLLAFPTQVRMK